MRLMTHRALPDTEGKMVHCFLSVKSFLRRRQRLSLGDLLGLGMAFETEIRQCRLGLFIVLRRMRIMTFSTFTFIYWSVHHFTHEQILVMTHGT